MKIIMNKNHDEIFNLERIRKIHIRSYVNSDKYVIEAAGSQPLGEVLGEYNTYDEAQTALGMLL